MKINLLAVYCKGRENFITETSNYLMFSYFHIDLLIFSVTHMSPVMRKRDFCLCENKGADQLHSNCKADQRLCFGYMDSTTPTLLMHKFSRF